MRRSTSWRIATLSLMAVCGVTAIVWSRSQVHAAIPPAGMLTAAVTQFGGGGMAKMEGGGIGRDEANNPPEAPKIYVRMPDGPEALAAYKKLQQKIDMPFTQETPLGDVIKYLVEQLNPTDKDGKPLSDGPPLQFYVNPIGLEETEKTIDSPVTLDLKQIPASSALELCLKQLGLTSRVRPDGIIEIDAELSSRPQEQEPILLILNELRQLRTEVSQLKSLHSGMRMGSGPPSGGGLR